MRYWLSGNVFKKGTLTTMKHGKKRLAFLLAIFLSLALPSMTAFAEITSTGADGTTESAEPDGTDESTAIDETIESAEINGTDESAGTSETTESEIATLSPQGNGEFRYDLDAGSLESQMKADLDAAPFNQQGNYDYSVLRKLILTGTATDADWAFMTTSEATNYIEEVDLAGISNTAYPYHLMNMNTLKKARLPANLDLVSRLLNVKNLTTVSFGNTAFEEDVVDFTGYNGALSYSNSPPGSTSGSPLFEDSGVKKVRLHPDIELSTSSNMFRDCNSLESLVFGPGAFQDGVFDFSGYTGTSYSSYMFSDQNLHDGANRGRLVRLRDDIELADSMFFGCTNLRTLAFGSEPFKDGIIDFTGYTPNTYGNSSTFSYSGVVKIRLKSGLPLVTSMFSYCQNLRTLVCGSGDFTEGVIDLAGTGISDAPTSYSNGVFYQSGITSVRLRGEISLDHYELFSRCMALDALTFVGGSTAPPVSQASTFHTVPAAGTLYYPAAASGYAPQGTFASPDLDAWQIVPYSDADATLFAVAGKTVTTTGGSGTASLPWVAEVSVPNAKSTISLLTDDIYATPDASKGIFTDSSYGANTNSVNLSIGDNHIYIKVTSKDTFLEQYYDVTVKRSNVPVDASLSRQTATWDVNPNSPNHGDITTTLNPGSYTLQFVAQGGNLAGVTSVGDDYTIPASVLDGIYQWGGGIGTYNFLFGMSGGQNPVMKVTIVDTRQAPSTKPDTAIFNKNTSSPGYRDIATTFDPGDFTFGWSIQDEQWSYLSGGSDYTVSGKVYTFKKAYLETFAAGTVKEIRFLDNNYTPMAVLRITIIDEVPVTYPVQKHPDDWTGSGDAKAIVDADHTKFIRLVRDDANENDLVEPIHYTIGAGSTVVTLHESYIKALGVGIYHFKAEFTDGSSERIRLEITSLSGGSGGTGGSGGSGGSGGNGNQNNQLGTGGFGTSGVPNTGDDADLMAFAILFLISGACLLLSSANHIRNCRKNSLQAATKRQ